MRIVMAVAIIVTGNQKLNAGLERVTQIMVRSNLPLPEGSAALIIALEFFGGILLLLGLGGRLLGLLYVVEFLVVPFYVQLPAEGIMPARLSLLFLGGA